MTPFTLPWRGEKRSRQSRDRWVRWTHRSDERMSAKREQGRGGRAVLYPPLEGEGRAEGAGWGGNALAPPPPAVEGSPPPAGLRPSTSPLQGEVKGVASPRPPKRSYPPTSGAAVSSSSSPPTEGRAHEASSAWGGERRLPVPHRRRDRREARYPSAGTTTGCPLALKSLGEGCVGQRPPGRRSVGLHPTAESDPSGGGKGRT